MTFPRFNPRKTAIMRFEFLIAIRYLKAKRKQAVVSLITIISIIGVAAGVAALIIALAINAGFRQDLREKLLGAQAHLTLLDPTGEGITDYRKIADEVSKIEGVKAVSPALYQTVLLSSTVRSRGVWMKGIIPELETKRSDVLDTLVDGQLEDFKDDSILIGDDLAQHLGSFVGDHLRVLSAETTLTPMGPAPMSRMVEVVGIFKSGLYEFDAGWVFVSLENAQRLSRLGLVVSSIEVQVEDLDKTDLLGSKIVADLPQGLAFTDWKSQNSAVFQALQLERLVMIITIGLIVVVASLNIIVTLIMMVMEKTRDIAVLMSMGATKENIRRIFMAQGVIIGVVGTAVGLVLGNTLAWAADAYQLVSLAPDVYSIAYVPFKLSSIDSAIVAVSAILISYVATLYPSLAASRLQPVEALRYE